MNDTMQSVVLAVVSAIVGGFIVLMFSGLVGGNQLGAGSRFPNGISADGTSPAAGEVRGTSLQLDNGAATTSFTMDKVCYTFTDAAGNALYGWYNKDGVFATSSTSCL